jgi:exonuclease SbcD
VSIIEFKANETPVIKERALMPLHEWYDLRGTYDELTAKDFYDGKGYQEAYVRITLTDEEDIPDGMRKLRTIYHRLTELLYDNKRTRAGLTNIGKPLNVNTLNPAQLFGELFEKQNAQPLSDKQSKYINGLIDQIFNN